MDRKREFALYRILLLVITQLLRLGRGKDIDSPSLVGAMDELDNWVIQDLMAKSGRGSDG